MGGIPTTVVVPPTQEEVIARLLELGRETAVPDPHTVYIVEDAEIVLAYPSRSVVDNCFHAMPVGHLTAFKFSVHRMTRLRTAFYRDREAAFQDATGRAAAREPQE